MAGRQDDIGGTGTPALRAAQEREPEAVQPSRSQEVRPRAPGIDDRGERDCCRRRSSARPGRPSQPILGGARAAPHPPQLRSSAPLPGSRAIRAAAVGAVAAGVAAPLVRRRLRLPAPAVIGLAGAAPVALCVAVRRSPARDVGTCLLQMWAYVATYEMPNDDPERAARARVRDRLPDRGRPRPRPGHAARRCASSATRAARAASPRARRCWCGRTGSGSWCPHGSMAYILAPPPRALPARGRDDLRDLRRRRDRLLGAAHRAALVRRAARPAARLPTGRTWRVRRMMVEYGEQFWEDGWQRLYSFLAGNPLAAMPSLHFATSVMAAHLLAETGPVAGAVGWAYAAHARLRARLPRRALPRRPARRSRARPRAIRARGAAGRAARRAPSSRGRAGARGAGARPDVTDRRAWSPGRRAPVDSASDAGDGRRRGDAAAARSRARAALFFGLFVVGAVVLPVLRPAADRRLAGHLAPHRQGDPWWLASRAVFEVLLVRRLHRALPHGVRPRRGRASTGARATRSRWPGWSRRGCSRRPGRAASRSPHGRCGARGWSGGSSPAAWSPSSSLLYAVYMLALVHRRARPLPGDLRRRPAPFAITSCRRSSARS